MKKIIYIEIILAILLAINTLNIFCQNRNTSYFQIIKKDTGQIDSSYVINYLNKYLGTRYNKGFIADAYDSIVFDTVKVQARLIKNQKYYWGELIPVNIDKKEYPNVYKALEGLKNKPVSPEYFEYKMNNILKQFCNNGYPFAVIYLDNISISDNKVNAQLKLIQNGRYYIDSVISKGTIKINQKLLCRILNIKTGEIYNDEKINSISQQINNVKFIKEIRPYELEFFEDKARIFIYPEKNNSNYFDALIGIYPSDNNNKKINVTGEVNLNLLNSFRHAEQFTIQWRRITNQTQSMNLSVEWPYLFTTIFGFESGFKLYKKDTSFLNIDFNEGFRLYNSSNNYLRIFFERNTSIILNQFNNKGYRSYKANMAGIGYNYSNIDYIYNPSKGFETNFNFIEGIKKTSDTGLYENKIISKLNMALYVPLKDKFVIKIQNKTGCIISKDILENEMMKIGGQETVRGLDESNTLASFYSVISFEFRFLFEKNSSLFLFSDIGYYQKQSILENIYDEPFSFGIGLNLFTKSGIFTMNYALIRQFKNPLDISSSKIYIGYINRF